MFYIKLRLIMLFFSVYCFSLGAMNSEVMGVMVSKEMTSAVPFKEVTSTTTLSDFIGVLDRPLQYGTTRELDELVLDVETNIDSLYGNSNGKNLFPFEKRRYSEWIKRYFEGRRDEGNAYRELRSKLDEKLAKLKNPKNQVDKKIILEIEYDIRASKKAIEKWKREISRVGKIVLRNNERVLINSRLEGQVERDKLELSMAQETMSRMKDYILQARKQIQSLKKEILIKKENVLMLEGAIFRLEERRSILYKEYGWRLEEPENILKRKQPNTIFDVSGSEDFSGSEGFFDRGYFSDNESFSEGSIDVLSEGEQGPQCESDDQQEPQCESRSRLSFLQKNGMRIGLTMALGGALMCAVSAGQLISSLTKA